MGIIRRWMATSSPLVKGLMAISVLSLMTVAYRSFYAPYVRRERFRIAEEWANIIFEEEEKMQDNPEYKSDKYNVAY